MGTDKDPGGSGADYIFAGAVAKAAIWLMHVTCAAGVNRRA